MNKKIARIRRRTKTRAKLNQLNAIRLIVHRTSRHIYAQIIEPENYDTLVTASTTEKVINKEVKYTGNKIAAMVVGKLIAERALAKGIKNVSFDRSGFQYHGRIKELADAARKAGLNF
ncbi:50S ribosomal protein L18 [Arsenophonus symbiont of Ornithomya chloropus]|uniref:50S ribosomal protein L18 n=1 Tax=Arsenophonus symbiont of Ornithomya chloropus TaxID=634121 RepID=UPI0032B2520A